VADEVATEQVLRTLAPQVLAAVVRRYGDFETCEDAVQEALLAASVQWPRDGRPDDPKAWLITAAARRRIEMWRSSDARRRRELAVVDAAGDPPPVPGTDDTLVLLMMCCHPALTRASQVALTLRAVGGLTTAEIGRAFLVSEATVAQRISRAKARIRSTGAEFALPPAGERPERLAAVLHVLYLVFNEGYTASSGGSLRREELSAEAIRLVRQLHDEDPDDGEIAGLLALMLLTDARRDARTDDAGRLVPLAAQDRSRWDRTAITEGTALVSHALAHAELGPYQLQAAIAAVHDEATDADATDWQQILGLYLMLDRVAPGPMVTLNRAVALAMVHGPEAGLRELELLADEPGLAGHHRLAAVRGHLLEQCGDHAAAVAAYELAARQTLSVPEQQHLRAQAARLR